MSPTPQLLMDPGIMYEKINKKPSFEALTKKSIKYLT
jgi:hypothetical protein